jgi:PAS domain S-box-containing protein
MCKTVTGYTPEDFINDPYLWIDMVVPEDRARVADHFSKILVGGTIEPIEHRVIRKDGKIMWISDTTIPKYDSNGVIVSYDGVIKDISEQKYVLESLRESDQQFRTLAALAPVGIYLTDPLGNCLYANPAWCKMSGLTQEEALGDGWGKGLHPDDRDKVYMYWNQMVESNGKWGMEYRFLTSEGKVTIVYGLAAPQYDSSGKVSRYVGVNLDITERKESEQAVVESEHRLKSLLRILQSQTNTIQELLDFTLDEALSLTNSKLAYIYFYSEETKEFTLFSWSKGVMKECSIMNPQTLYKLEQTGIWGEAVRQRKPIMINDFAQSNPLKKGYPEGHAHLNKFLTIPVFVNNAIVAVAGVANKTSDYRETDILHLTLLMNTTWKTLEKKHAEEMVKTQNTELLKINADKDRFMSILAHDLKSPFNGLLGLSEILAKNTRAYNIDKIEKLASSIHKSAVNTYNLLEDLLLWTRSQSGKIPFEPRELIFKDMYDNILQDLKITADTKNIKIKNKTKGKINIFADSDMLKSVMRNLISNAIKFTRPDGKIDISAKTSGSGITISVLDNGVGIEPDALTKLFDISQINTTRGTANETGTGLGLLLCKDFIEKHGGIIWAESTVGKGSDFRFTLPIKSK